MPIMRGGQDFVIPFESASGTSHLLTRSNNASLEPRVPKMLGRLSMLPAGRGLLTRLSVSGHNLVLGDGFPLEALVQNGITDRHNFIGIAAGPNTPLEIEATLTAAADLAGYIGTDPIPPELIQEVLAAHDAGELWGQPNYAWGLGELTQPTADAVETVSFSARIPRQMHLERLVVKVYQSDQAAIVQGDCKLTKFQIQGFDMLSRSGNMDALLLDPFNSDEDGLMIGETIDTDDLVEMDFQFASLGAGVKGAVQVGYWTS